MRAPRVRGAVRVMRPMLPGMMRMLRSVCLPGARLERQQGGDVVDRLIAQIDRPVALFLGEILIGLTPLKADLQLTLQLLRVALLERRDEGRRNALCACAARAPNAMHKVI